ncbi:prolactin-releasing peptide [Protopterus annectens]|uniref:prolactin-releasing peptide n=1 Tax=Protopterus annectens TaxID=7888 RepID=UPI001CFB9D03|nr:prolactin-releasing peptide [Protopterus annectens]
MKLPVICLICLLLLCLALPETSCRIHERSMEIRNPDIDASWYTGRGIRPVGRFGRRDATFESPRKSSYGVRRVCIPVEESDETVQDE